MKSALIFLCLLSLALSELPTILEAEQEHGEELHVPPSYDEYDQELEMRDEFWPSCKCTGERNNLYRCFCSGNGGPATRMDHCSCRTAMGPYGNNQGGPHFYVCRDCYCNNSNIDYCTWNDWSSWGSCSKTCGGGTKTRSRTPRECSGSPISSTSCNTDDCPAQPVDCTWGAWSSWTSCSRTCGRGSQSRSRTENTQRNGGAECSGSPDDTRSCNTDDCPAQPVDCTWGAWSSWTSCSRTCGGGSESRSRTKNIQRNGGAECSGSPDDTRSCNTNSCQRPCAPGQGSYWENDGNDKCCNGRGDRDCKEGEGDCDSDSDCEGSLICGYNNCPWGDKDDCCQKPSEGVCSPDGKNSYWSNEGNKECCNGRGNRDCDIGEGDCDRDSDCKSGLICGYNNCPWGDKDDCCQKPSEGVCSPDGKNSYWSNEGNNECCNGRGNRDCDIGEGDCDRDSDCKSGLICGYNNCPWGDKDDCCQKPSEGVCSPDGKNSYWRNEGNEECCNGRGNRDCDFGEGDCDRDSDCKRGLKCGRDNCYWGDGDDCCE